jgi:hypothetical protein
MITLRLLADDLTGALDSAARFVPLVGTVPTFWRAPLALPATAAIDGETREICPSALAAAMRALAPLLDGADLAFKKIDSLLRGGSFDGLRIVSKSGAFGGPTSSPACWQADPRTPPHLSLRHPPPVSADWTALPRIGYAVHRARDAQWQGIRGGGAPGVGGSPRVEYTRLCPARRRPPGTLHQAPTLALGDGKGTGWNPASSDCVSNEA